MTLSNLEILNARLPGCDHLSNISIDAEGLITRIQTSDSEFQPLEASQTPQLDVAGDWISLGGIDLQINGALGLAFPDLEEKDIPFLEEICQFLWQKGVDGFLPTIVTTSINKIHQSLSIFAEVIAQPPKPESAQILGVHLEGPFLNPTKRGAHPQAYLLPLTLEKVKQALGDYAAVIKIMTLAPELDSTGEVIPYLKSLGITVSLGHSLATEIQANLAFEQGASLITHAFNAMPGLHHREPGLLGAALTNQKVKSGVIADGKHICPTMLKLLVQCNLSGLFLVSDALAPLGLADGIYPWDKRKIEVKEGTARLPDGTLSGTTLPLLAGVQNLVKWGICEVGDAIALATESPRQALGLAGLSVHQPAHLLRWHFDETQQELTWQRLSN